MIVTKVEIFSDLQKNVLNIFILKMREQLVLPEAASHRVAQLLGAPGR